MTIDEAIEHERNIVESQKILYEACILKEQNAHFLRQAEEHEQLAEWLEELKAYRECNVCEYNKAIDDFICNIEKDARYEHPIEVIEVDRCRYIAEQLKAGVSNE